MSDGFVCASSDDAKAGPSNAPMSATTTVLPVPSADVLLTELPGGQGVLLSLTTKFYFTLNPTALVVWRALLEPGMTRETIADKLVAVFEVERATALRDVDALLVELRNASLLV